MRQTNSPAPSPRRSLPVLLALALLWLLPSHLASPTAPTASAQRFGAKEVRNLEWHRIATEAGITVFAKEHETIDLPSFRAVGHVNAPLFHVMAVLEDAEAFPNWVERCAESRELVRTSETSGVLYSRTKVPWPVSDRDVVLDVRFTYDREAGEVVSRFVATRHPQAPTVNGVVRMRRLVGHVRLKAVGPARTHITYEVNADPGGMIPKWLAKMVSREIPLKTVKALRKRVVAVGGRYDQRIARWEATLGRPTGI